VVDAMKELSRKITGKDRKRFVGTWEVVGQVWIAQSRSARKSFRFGKSQIRSLRSYGKREKGESRRQGSRMAVFWLRQHGPCCLIVVPQYLNKSTVAINKKYRQKCVSYHLLQIFLYDKHDRAQERQT